jgi:hypothetical protein
MVFRVAIPRQKTLTVPWETHFDHTLLPRFTTCGIMVAIVNREDAELSLVQDD